LKTDTGESKNPVVSRLFCISKSDATELYMYRKQQLSIPSLPIRIHSIQIAMPFIRSRSSKLKKLGYQGSLELTAAESLRLDIFVERMTAKIIHCQHQAAKSSCTTSQHFSNASKMLTYPHKALFTIRLTSPPHFEDYISNPA